MSDTVMYILVNTDLKMGKGKIAAQVAHSAIKASRKAETSEEHRENWVRWYSPSHMFRIPGDSKGVDKEEGFAKYNDIPIFYNLDTLNLYSALVIDCRRKESYSTGGTLNNL